MNNPNESAKVNASANANANATSKVHVGVDVSKDRLDVHVRPNGLRRRFDNDADGIEKLVAWLKPFAPHRIVFESTGPYQKPAVAALLLADLPAVVVNARQVRDFAKGVGKLAKNDTIDAEAIAHFAEVVETTVREMPTAELEELTQLCNRRDQLVRMLVAEKNHKHAAAHGSPNVMRHIEKTIRWLESQILDIERRMNKIVRSSPTLKKKDDILQSIKGVGPQISRTLIVFLPELGQASRTEIASLAGLAPFDADSGRTKGARHIRGGRSKVRADLHMAAMSAICHITRMKEFYAALKARGKTTKAALVAVARKILVLANALMRTGARYDPNHPSNAESPRAATT